MRDWPTGIGRVVLERVDSTSAEAARRAADAPLWVLAHAQTAARGRRGRPWAMPPGNFAASLAWRPDAPPAAMALRSFAAALALDDALTSLGVTDLSLKWPNDVLLRDAKLAGILLECPAPGLLVLGIGVNLAIAPDAAALEPAAVAPTSLLAATGIAVAPEALLDRLAPAFAAREAQLVARGFAPVRADWLARAARLGQRITARTMTETTTGTFDDVDGAGHLILGTAQGPRRIAAADVFFEPAQARLTREGAACS